MFKLSDFGKSSGRPLRDQVTPHKISLAILIKLYRTDEFAQKDDSRVLDGASECFTEKEHRQCLITLLELLQSADLDLKELYQRINGVIQARLLETFVSNLEEVSSDSERGLMDLFMSLNEALNSETPLFNKSSVVGLFVRRMVLAFEMLSFSQVSKLHTRFKCYFNAWHVSHQRKQSIGPLRDPANTSEFGDSSFSIMDMTGENGEMNISDIPTYGTKATAQLNSSNTETGRFSQRQAEFFIAQQAALLQHNEAEALPPKKLQAKIAELLKSNPDLAEAHFLSYMNNLRVNEYCGALESLYHNFDCHGTSADLKQAQGANPKAKSEEEIISKGFRYAALSLAGLHHRFGHHREALAAVQESIRIAQEANDHVCLQHALSWLQRLGVQGTGNTSYLLDRLVIKAGELNLPYLTSMGVQAFAKHNSIIGAEPASVFDFLLKSDIVNCQHSLSDMMCVSYSQKAALWQMYGRREMNSLAGQCMLNLNTSDLGVYHSGEAECLALCQLSRLHFNQGDFKNAFDILTHAEKSFPLESSHSHIWMGFRQGLIFERAVYQGKWSVAENAVIDMSAMDPLEACYCQALLQKEKGKLLEAFKSVENLMKKCQEDKNEQSMASLLIRLLILQGELYCCSGNPTAAGQPLLSCITIAKEHHFSYYVAKTKMHLAFVQFCLGMPRQALALLEEVLVSILSHGSVSDKAKAHFLWLKCEIAAASKDKKKQVLLSSVQMIGKIIEWFKQLEAYHKVKDAVYLQARIYNELGYSSERNKCAYEFKQLDIHYPTWQKCTVISM